MTSKRIHCSRNICLAVAMLLLAGCKSTRYCHNSMVEEDGGFFYEKDGGYFYEKDGGYFYEKDGSFFYEKDGARHAVICRRGVRVNG